MTLRIGRRTFLLGMGGLVGMGLAAACAPAPVPTSTATAIPNPNPKVAPTLAATRAPSPTLSPPPPSSTPAPPTAAPPTPTITLAKVDLAVARGNASPEALTKAALEALGGISRFVKPGQRVVVKPNIGFSQKPELAATTNPEVMATLVKLCFQAGASRVVVFDDPVSGGATAYQESGIEEAVASAGAQVVRISRLKYRETPIPSGHALKSWPINEDALDTDVFINVPIAKHHNLTGLTLGLKNLMGVCGGNRGRFHQNMAPCLVDVSSVVPVHLTVVDAVRILVRNGPSGGNPRDVERPNTVIASTDPVAADAYAASLFGKQPTEVAYIKAAAEAGLGQMDPRRAGLKEVQL